jgi:hypothetical protein
MEELIFFAVIIFFSIIESIARSRKKQSGAPRTPEDSELEEAARDWGGRTAREAEARRRVRSPAPTYETSTYDADRSYDDVERDEAAESREAGLEPSRPYPTGARGADARSSGSEGMIPADIWEEIAGLARGRMRQLETRPEPAAPTPPTPASPARLGWGKREPRVGQQHRVHLAHTGYGTDPSTRVRSEQEGLDPLARALSADAAAVRKQLRRGGRHALRQAVILQEVLGPPASMRREPFPE